MSYIHWSQIITCDDSRQDANKIAFGEKSESGTGGMESKVKSALWALDNGSSVVICNGMKYNTIRKVMRGEKVGSFFTKTESETIPVEVLAKNGERKATTHQMALLAHTVTFFAQLARGATACRR